MTEKKIHRICKKYNIINYTIEDGLVNVDSGVDLFNMQITKLPLKFNYVSGYFDCGFNKLETLEGAPLEVGGDFLCDINELKSLKFSPLKVGGGFDCSNNKLTSLEGAPMEVGGIFYCHGNKKGLSYEKHLNKINRLNKLKQVDVG